MNHTEPNFEDLKRLLKLKRHEVPPPGYFEDFSGKVVSRIRAGENRGRRTFTERLENQSPWLMGLFRIFETRPGLVGGFATSLCLLLLVAVVFAERSDVASKNLLTISDPSPAGGSSVASMTSPVLIAATDTSGIVASTNPVTSLQPATTLFGQPAGASLFQQAGFLTASH
jgi:hypothetical protein